LAAGIAQLTQHQDTGHQVLVARELLRSGLLGEAAPDAAEIANRCELDVAEVAQHLQRLLRKGWLFLAEADDDAQRDFDGDGWFQGPGERDRWNAGIRELRSRGFRGARLNVARWMFAYLIGNGQLPNGAEIERISGGTVEHRRYAEQRDEVLEARLQIFRGLGVRPV
jgi:hypothetical protein